EAAAKIDDRIAKGKKLLEAAADVLPPHFAQLRGEYYKWTEYNAELLGQLFTTRKLADEYEFAGSSPVIGLGEESFAQQRREAVEDIHHKIQSLESIK